jgi:hypothetical protein
MGSVPQRDWQMDASKQIALIDDSSKTVRTLA